MNPIVVASSDRVTATHVGGVTTYVERLYDSLREIDVDLRVFGIRTRAKGVRRSVAYAKQEALALPRMARKAGADILHYPADTGPIRTSRGLPTVVTIHGAAALHERGIRKPIAERVWMTRVRRAGVVADAIVTDSESSRADVAALVGDRRRADIVVIPLAVDPGRFYPVDRDHVESVRSRHGLEDRYLLYVGNLEPRRTSPSW
jgi:glycosyltransferase involved in cell wall biosynthesis